MISKETIRKALESMSQIQKIGRGEDFGDWTSFLLNEKIAGLLDKYFIFMDLI